MRTWLELQRAWIQMIDDPREQGADLDPHLSLDYKPLILGVLAARGIEPSIPKLVELL